MNITPDITLLTKELNNLPNKKSIQATANQLENSKSNEELKKACDGFEELFVHKMLQVMRQSTEKSGLISGGRGEEIFQDMLDRSSSCCFSTGSKPSVDRFGASSSSSSPFS